MTAYTSKEIVALVDGVTYRQLDYWCRIGLFGVEQRDLGSGQRRSFDDTDLAVFRALGIVSGCLDEHGQRRNPLGSDIYRLIALQVRDGATHIVVRLGDRVRLTVDLTGLDDAEAAA